MSNAHTFASLSLVFFLCRYLTWSYLLYPSTASILWAKRASKFSSYCVSPIVCVWCSSFYVFFKMPINQWKRLGPSCVASRVTTELNSIYNVERSNILSFAIRRSSCTKSRLFAIVHEEKQNSMTFVIVTMTKVDERCIRLAQTPTQSLKHRNYSNTKSVTRILSWRREREWGWIASCTSRWIRLGSITRS